MKHFNSNVEKLKVCSSHPWLGLTLSLGYLLDDSMNGRPVGLAAPEPINSALFPPTRLSRSADTDREGTSRGGKKKKKKKSLWNRQVRQEQH